MRRAIALSLSLSLAGCSLVLDAGDHLGGIGVEDGGADGGRDASVADAGDAGTEPDASADGGPDAGPPPPECASDATCGAPGVAGCVAGRCVFCAAFSAATTVASSAGYDGHLSLAIGEAGASSEIALAWTGAGSAAYLHRTPLVAPAAAAGTLPSRTDELVSQLGTDATMDVIGLELGTSHYDSTNRRFEIAAVLRDPTRSGHNYALWSPTGLTSLTYPNPANYVDPVRDLAPIVLAGTGLAIGRRTDGLGNVRYVSYETSYGNEQESLVASELTAETVDPVVAGRLVGTPVANGLLLWDGAPDNTPRVVLTSDRTGRAAMGDAGGDTYLVAYPVGSQVRVRLLRCYSAAVSSCSYDASVTVDVETGAESVDRVSVVSSADRPVLLSYERAADGSGRLVMRALRMNGLPFDAPDGGTALVLDTVPAGSTFHDARLALAGDGASGRYVAAWMRGPEGAGARDVRIRSIPIVCEP